MNAQASYSYCPNCGFVAQMKEAQKPSIDFRKIGKKIWNFNWTVYQRSKPFLLVISVLTLCIVIGMLLSKNEFAIVPFAVWLSLMAVYEIATTKKEVKR
ncbi:MAG: hypothetical protein DRP11_02705 [Candidatus Aenigmatarchaeota archaeon]|nr:MAG: hypothetical protein DRP11_02705 [Candidatus Aenigmarchaeota archaeon]